MGSLGAFLDWTSTSLQDPAFPRLEILEFVDTVLDLEQFDRIIQERCLPATHSRSDLANDCRPLQKLMVALPKGYVGSQFLAEATLMEKKDDNMACLSWL